MIRKSCYHVNWTTMSATEHELLQIYMNHVKNVRSLLIKLQNKRKGKLKKQLDDLKFNPAC